LAQVNTVSGYKLNGESCDPAKGGTRGFGIYPARIDINTAGAIHNWGSPVADTVNDPGAGTALPSAHIVLEFASLYYNKGTDHNEPNTSGTLCKLNLIDNGQTTNYSIKMSAETTYRGGVVLSDGTQFVMPDSNITIVKATPPGPASSGTPQPNVTGLSVPLTWTAGSGATSHDVYFGTNTSTWTLATVAMPTVTLATGTMIQGKTYYVRVVAKNAAGNATNYDWNFSTDCYKSTGPDQAVWVQFGRPACWCFQRQCRGDAEGTKVGVQWVQALDLTIFAGAYGKNVTLLAQVPNGICADFDHAKVGVQRVQANDLTPFATYYGKNQTIVTVCPNTNVNFWMN
jgi:hypothetical protein